MAFFGYYLFNDITHQEVILLNLISSSLNFEKCRVFLQSFCFRCLICHLNRSIHYDFDSAFLLLLYLLIQLINHSVKFEQKYLYLHVILGLNIHCFLNYSINAQEKDHLFLQQNLSQYLIEFNFGLNNKKFLLNFEEFKLDKENLQN